MNELKATEQKLIESNRIGNGNKSPIENENKSPK